MEPTFSLNLVALAPELFLALAGMVLLIAGVVRGNVMTCFLTWSVMFCFAIAGSLVLSANWETVTALNSMVIVDGFGNFMKLVVLLGLIAALAISVSSLEQDHIARFEYPILVLFAGIGMLLMISANNMLSLYMALELQSLPLYVLAAFRRSSVKSAEAGMKYFVLGALSSGMLLFGISLIYGFTGSLQFDALAAFLAGDDALSLGLVIGLVFLLAGLAFKISSVPFHMWTPDVYEGAPTAVTALFAIAPKIAALALLMRLLFQVFPDLSDQWQQIIWFMSLASMTWAGFAGLVQNNIKRLMAYSSIGNLGYALIGLAAVSTSGSSAAIIYMVIYMVMTIGAFGIVLSMRREGMPVERISDLAGYSKHAPVMAYVMAFLLLSMMGIPPLAGFFGKALVFMAAIEAEMYVLAVLGVITSVIAAYYYLRIIKVMFFDYAGMEFDTAVPFERRVVILIAMLFVIGFIVKPDLLIDSAKGAASSLSVFSVEPAAGEDVHVIEATVEAE